MGAGVLEMREPKSVTAQIQWRGQWYVIRFSRDKWELEVQVIKDLVMDGSKVLEFELGVFGMKPFKESDLSLCKKGCSRTSVILWHSSACAGR